MPAHLPPQWITSDLCLPPTLHIALSRMCQSPLSGFEPLHMSALVFFVHPGGLDTTSPISPSSVLVTSPSLPAQPKLLSLPSMFARSSRETWLAFCEARTLLDMYPISRNKLARMMGDFCASLFPLTQTLGPEAEGYYPVLAALTPPRVHPDKRIHLRTAHPTLRRRPRPLAAQACALRHRKRARRYRHARGTPAHGAGPVEPAPVCGLRHPGPPLPPLPSRARLIARPAGQG